MLPLSLLSTPDQDIWDLTWVGSSFGCSVYSRQWFIECKTLSVIYRCQYFLSCTFCKSDSLAPCLYFLTFHWQYYVFPCHHMDVLVVISAIAHVLLCHRKVIMSAVDKTTLVYQRFWKEQLQRSSLDIFCSCSFLQKGKSILHYWWPS